MTLEGLKIFGGIINLPDPFLGVHLRNAENYAKNKLASRYNSILLDQQSINYMQLEKAIYLLAMADIITFSNQVVVKDLPYFSQEGIGRRFFSPDETIALANSYRAQADLILYELDKDSQPEGKNSSITYGVL